MKGAIIFLLAVALAIAGAGWYHDNLETVKSKDFKIEIAKLKTELDSIKRNQDTLKKDVREIKIDLDTVKLGNELIFKTMNENKGRSLFDLF